MIELGLLVYSLPKFDPFLIYRNTFLTDTQGAGKTITQRRPKWPLLVKIILWCTKLYHDNKNTYYKRQGKCHLEDLTNQSDI